VRQLLWKEWHEQAWKLAFGCVVLSAMAVIGLHARMVADATMVDWVCWLGLTLLPVLSSTGLVPAERAEGSLESLLAMPIAPWRILAAKTSLGLLLCVGPLAVAGALSVALAGGRETYTGDIVSIYARSALAGAALFVWMQAMTVRLPSEARAGLIAVGVLIIWGLVTVGLLAGNTLALRTGLAASPFSLVLPMPDRIARPPVGLTIAVQAALAVGAWLLTLRLFKVDDAGAR
jgi:ABC-type transport system involved in cytochrome c biogenesis permease component